MQQSETVYRQPAQPVLEDPNSLTTLCKASADGLRLNILRILRTDSLGVLEMSRILDIRQTALSHHLKILAKAGLVSTRRESNTIFYRRVFLIADDPLALLKSAIFDSVDKIQLDPELNQRLFNAKKEREQQSLGFFNRHASKFKQNQDLVVRTTQYTSSLVDLIRELRLAEDASVLEVGPGEGELLAILAGEFSRVIALDNSEEMLLKARARIEQQNLDNVDFVSGDTKIAVAQGLAAELIVISMVLHHVSSPAEIFMDSARLLGNHGILLIVDLCRHNQDWVRDACGDLWLGFEPEELTNWAQQAGFRSGQSLYLGLRNGFQIQMRLFHKQA